MTSTPDRDGVVGKGLPFPPEKEKTTLRKETWTKYMKQPRQWTSAMKDHEYCDCPSFLPGENVQAVAPAGRMLVVPGTSLSWGDGVGSLEWQSQLEFSGQSSREERAVHREKSEELQKVPLESLASLDWHM